MLKKKRGKKWQLVLYNCLWLKLQVTRTSPCLFQLRWDVYVSIKKPASIVADADIKNHADYPWMLMLVFTTTLVSRTIVTKSTNIIKTDCLHLIIS